MLIHLVVVLLNAVLVTAIAGVLLSFLVLCAGGLAGFGRVWRDARFRPHRLAPAASWGIVSTLLKVPNALERLRPFRVGDVPVLSAAPFDESDLGYGATQRVALLVHGTWGRLQNYDWSRWNVIAAELRAAGWTPMRFAWTGGNRSQARRAAAAGLAREISRLRAEHPGIGVTLVGHSHGGSVALETARQAPVDAVVTLATPHIAIAKELVADKPLITGLLIRLTGPAILAAMLLIFELPQMAIGAQWAVSPPAALGLLGAAFVVGVWALVHQLNVSALEVDRANLSATTGVAEVLAIDSVSDAIMAALSRIDAASRLARREIAGPARYERLLARISSGGVGAANRASAWAPWARDWGKFILFGSSVIACTAMALEYGAFTQDVRRWLGPWVLPAENFSNFKFIVYALALGAAYAAVAFCLGARRLPSWHRWAFRAGRYLGLAARLSQLYSFRAALLGLPGLALHLHNASLVAAPAGGRHLPVAADIPIGHSEILRDPQVALAVAAIATRAAAADASGRQSVVGPPLQIAASNPHHCWHVRMSAGFGIFSVVAAATWYWLTFHLVAPAHCAQDAAPSCVVLVGLAAGRSILQVVFVTVLLISVMCGGFLWITRNMAPGSAAGATSTPPSQP